MNLLILIDQQDKVRLLIDPTSSYAKAAAYAMGRAMDDVIIAAALEQLTLEYLVEQQLHYLQLTLQQLVLVELTTMNIAKLALAKQKLLMQVMLILQSKDTLLYLQQRFKILLNNTDCYFI